ncbi:hypothetical protein F5X68DRAFT_37020 [Plectosphaerella plurivora]|uniref:Uncharacterized protein n=1 Tax=Plectosphaerella plurivora TaxID=936078 RepID=A0A9P8V5X6_9PEZI|nr:hypothetical protein F5X68DRAFT_37020 [Plectosphaerella plurivora]
MTDLPLCAAVRRLSAGKCWCWCWVEMGEGLGLGKQSGIMARDQKLMSSWPNCIASSILLPTFTAIMPTVVGAPWMQLVFYNMYRTTPVIMMQSTPVTIALLCQTWIQPNTQITSPSTPPFQVHHFPLRQTSRSPPPTSPKHVTSPEGQAQTRPPH